MVVIPRRVLCSAALCLSVLAGCFMPREHRYRLDCKTGDLEIVYYDLRTDQTADSAVQKDWQDLREMVSTPDTVYDSSVIRSVSQELYQEDTVLCGKRTYRVRCPSCFPSKKDLLGAIVKGQGSDDIDVYEINDEIFLFLGKGSRLTSASGRVLRTANSSVAVWSVQDSVFEFRYSLSGEAFKTPLLPCYLKERPRQGKKAGR